MRTSNRLLRSRIAAAALALALAGCGEDDTPRGNTLNDDDDRTTTVADEEDESSDATTTSRPTGADDEPISTRQILARLVVQVDDAFRTAAARSRPCIVGPREQCTGETREAYTRLDDLAGALRFVLEGATNPESTMYSGRAADDAIVMIDESLNIGDDAKAKAEAAQAACLPEPTDGCEAASAALDAAVSELLKDMNRWRDHL